MLLRHRNILEANIERWYDHYHEQTVPLLRQWDCPPDQADDFFHAALEIIWKTYQFEQMESLLTEETRSTISEETDLSNLVKTIALRRWIDYCRWLFRYKKRLRELRPLLDDQEDTPRASAAIWDACRYDLFWEKFQSLPSEWRQLFDLRFQGYSWREIAEKLNIEGKNPENIVASRAKHYRKRLWEMIRSDRRCDEFHPL